MLDYRYKKKPVIIEAFQMTKNRRLDNSEWPEWLHKAWYVPLDEVGSLFCSNDGCLEGEKCTPLFVNTLEGVFRVSWDDYIIRGVHGELYSCKPDIFDLTYEKVMVD